MWLYVDGALAEFVLSSFVLLLPTGRLVGCYLQYQPRVVRFVPINVHAPIYDAVM